MYVGTPSCKQDEGDLFEYTTKQRPEKNERNKSFYHNRMGGSDYDKDAHARWRGEYDERHSSCNTQGFSKSGYSHTKVHPSPPAHPR